MNNLVQTEPVKPDGVHHLIAMQDDGFEFIRGLVEEPCKRSDFSYLMDSIVQAGLHYAKTSRCDLGALARLIIYQEEGRPFPVFISSPNNKPWLLPVGTGD